MAMQEELVNLTAKQRSFCIEYIKLRNGVAAARAAGYKGNANVLKSVASENLTKHNLNRAIEALEKPALEKAQVSTEKVIMELKAIAFASKDKVPLNSKLSALKLLGDHLGMWSDRRKDDDIRPSLAFHYHPGWTTDQARVALLDYLRNQ
jgi:hypothetical protein